MKGTVALSLGIAVGALVLGAALYPPTPEATKELSVTTQTLPELLPHFHGPGDKVDDIHHGVRVVSDPVVVPEDFWVTTIRISLENAPSNVIHHLYLLKLGSRDIDNPFSPPIFIIGQDSTTELSFPAPAGIFLAKGARIGIDALLHDAIPPEGEGGIYRDVRVTVTLSGVGDDEGRYEPVFFGTARLTDDTVATTTRAGNSTFSIEPHQEAYVRTSEMNNPDIHVGTFTFPADGWVLDLEGHLHAWQGGRRLDAFLNGARIASFHPRLEDASVPWSWRIDDQKSYLRVQKGDHITIAATYENPGVDAVVGAMAVLGFFYVPELPGARAQPEPWQWSVRSFLAPLFGYAGVSLP